MGRKAEGAQSSIRGKRKRLDASQLDSSRASLEHLLSRRPTVDVPPSHSIRRFLSSGFLPSFPFSLPPSLLPPLSSASLSPSFSSKHRPPILLKIALLPSYSYRSEYGTILPSRDCVRYESKPVRLFPRPSRASNSLPFEPRPGFHGFRANLDAVSQSGEEGGREKWRVVHGTGSGDAEKREERFGTFVNPFRGFLRNTCISRSRMCF